MKTREKKDLHTKEALELTKLLKEAKSALFTLQMDHAQRKLQNTKELFLKRRDIAQISSILKTKEVKHE